MELKNFKMDLKPNGVAVITFDRPPVNAQNRESREELLWLLDAVSERDEVKVVVLTGTGNIFSAGADIKERVGMTVEEGYYRNHNRLTREFFYAVTDCAKPVIAAINGAAIGAGYALAAGADIIIAAKSAYIQMPEIDRGLMGGAKFLDLLLPRPIARQLFLTCQKLYADDLYHYGAVTEVVEDEKLLDRAVEIADVIAAKDTWVVQKAKAAFNAAEGMGYRDGYRYEQTVTRELATSEYTKQAQKDFVEKKVK